MTAVTTTNTAQIAVEYFSDDVINSFIASRHGAANSQRTYRNAVKRMIQFFALKDCAAPTTSDFDAFINTLRGENKSDSTIRLYNTVGKMFFGYLEKHGVYRNVTADSEPLRLKKKNCA